MYAVVVRHMDDANLIDESGWMDGASFLFFWTRVIFLLINNYPTQRSLLFIKNIKTDFLRQTCLIEG